MARALSLPGLRPVPNHSPTLLLPYLSPASGRLQTIPLLFPNSVSPRPPAGSKPFPNFAPPLPQLCSSPKIDLLSLLLYQAHSPSLYHVHTYRHCSHCLPHCLPHSSPTKMLWRDSLCHTNHFRDTLFTGKGTTWRYLVFPQGSFEKRRGASCHRTKGDGRRDGSDLSGSRTPTHPTPERRSVLSL